MGAKWRSQLEGGGYTWTGTIPVRPWEPGDELIGGMDVAGSGHPCAYVVRTDELLFLTIRARESELPALRDILQWARSTAGILTFTPDVDVPGTTWSCYLHEPRAGQRLRFTRGQPERTFEIQVVLRSTDGTPFPSAYFTAGA